MATPGFTDSIFQSTLSVRRATRVYTGDTKILLISIHALRKESDGISNVSAHVINISIHALRKESDHYFLSSNH